MSANSKDRLGPYRAKRSAGKTPEPFGGDPRASRSKGGVFVVQKHAATRMHYDFRLEQDGVLLSWAVPRGPSLDPAEKRLAVQTEDHPIDYSDFEGVIPEGNYGAGAVIVWDRGVWTPVDDEDDRDSGKLHFELRGHKLRGRFALVRTKKAREKQPSKEWLLIKKRDGYADPDAELAETSIYSGLTVDEMRSGSEREKDICKRLALAGAALGEVDIKDVSLMLCEPRKRPFSQSGWIFELKYDGYRLLAGAPDGEAMLRYRRGMDATRLYPEVARGLAALPYSSVLLDGEVVVFDEAGRTDFARLQKRAMLARRLDVARAAMENPAHMVVFDLLEFAGYDLRSLPLLVRKQILRQVIPEAGPLRYADHVEEHGEDFCAKVAELHLEGIVAKRADSTYQARRSPDWRKIRLEYIDEFAVVGYSLPRDGKTEHFRALHLAARDGDGWVYAGAVGTGFSDEERQSLAAQLGDSPAAVNGFEEQATGGTNAWVEPRLVVQVRYLEWKEGRLLRQPVFLTQVHDMDPLDCQRRRVGADEPPPGSVPVVPDAAAGGAPSVALTNLDKPFWPEDGYTKGDLIRYYRTIYPWLKRYLEDRPLVLTRYPDGIHGKSFFQKDAPSWAPDWIRTETMWSEYSERHIHYFVCDNEESLAYLANLGTIPLHIWSSRLGSLQTPDWCILDLDPKDAPFADVVRCARAIKNLCDEIELPTFVKTSGSTGLHVLIPLAGQCTYEQSRTLANVVARIVEDENRDIATTARNPAKRDGKVYLDYLQNGHGRLLVAPFSVRPLLGAPVSMPIRWSEVKPSLDIRRFHIRNAATRMKRLKGDPLAAVLETRVDLMAALERLSERLGA